MPTSLTKSEQATLVKCETVIDRGLHSFVEVGNALMTIRTDRLYRTDDNPKRTFEDYCTERWDINKRYANRLVDSSVIVNHLGPMGPIVPANERQARPLADLRKDDKDKAIDLDQVGNVWKEVIERAPTNGNDQPVITAKHVAEIVKFWKAADEKYEDKEKAFDFDKESDQLFAWNRDKAEAWPQEYWPQFSQILHQVAEEYQ